MNNLRTRIFRNDDHSITISVFDEKKTNFCDITLNPSQVVNLCHEEGVGQDFKTITDGPLLLDEAIEYVESIFEIERPNVRAEK